MKSVNSPLQVIVKLVVQWWWLIVIAVALGAGIGYFIRSRQPNVYFAKSTVSFGQSIQKTATDQSFSYREQLFNLINTYAGLVRREKILGPVIQKLNLGISVEELNRRLTVFNVPNLPLIELTIADTNAVNAANIANAIAQQMIDDVDVGGADQEDQFTRGQLRDIAKQIEDLNTKYDDLLAKNSSLTSAFEISQNLDQQTKTLETIRELQKLYADLAAGLGQRVAYLQLYEAASASTAVVISGSSISIILSAGAGLILSVATIILIAFFDDRLPWQDTMESYMNLRVLGPLGIIPQNKLPLYVATMPGTIESEMIRQLRAKVVLAAGGVQPRVITVTSYDSGDGKTLTAANIALSAAQSGLRTVLVDGDIRKGDAHEVFRLPNVMGLSDILAGRDEIEILIGRALLDSGYDNLAILASGRSNADPAALVSSPRFAHLIRILRHQFDLVVMDSVPAIGGPDTAFIAEQSDGVVLVVHAQRTTRKALARALQVIQQTPNVHILGLAYNRIPLHVTSSYSKPYYRRDLAISPEKLSAELLGARTKQGRFAFNFKRSILVDRNGTQYFSLPASSVHLGVSLKTLKDWIKAGYLKAERRGFRQWINEHDMVALLERLPRHAIDVSVTELPAPAPAKIEPNGSKLATSTMPELLRGQREAILGYVREPVAPTPESDPEA